MADAVINDEGYQLYARRWFVLVVVCGLNFSNAMMWITFAPVTYYTNGYYCEGCDYAATLLNIVFMACSIPIGFVAMWSVDRFGLRSGCVFGAWTNCAGGIIRVIASTGWIPVHLRFPVVLAGQVIAACGQPFIMYLPTKLAAFWFPDNQRAIANTLSSMSNPLGIAAMYALSPLIVDAVRPDNFLVLNIIVAGPALLVALMTLGVTSSRPPSPPAASAASEEAPRFWAGLKMALRTPAFLVLAVTLGGGVGLFNSLYNNLQPMLCVKGYSDTFIGAMGALLIISGLIGAAISGVLVDKTKMFQEIMKVSFAGAGIAACSYCVAIQYEGQHAWVVASVFMFGLFGFAIYPIGLEIGVETTYPVAEATSTGLIIITGQIEGVLFVLITEALTQSTTTAEQAVQTCSVTSSDIEVKNWKWSAVAWNIMAVTLIVIFIIFFWPRYKRIEYENQKRVNRPLAGDSLQPPIVDVEYSNFVGDSSHL
uniref:Membrane transporter n=1 Tax=Plectus sambesii TaxID=2011161 RepID=A0A914UMK3_9BILA